MFVPFTFGMLRHHLTPLPTSSSQLFAWQRMAGLGDRYSFSRESNVHISLMQACEHLVREQQETFCESRGFSGFLIPSPARIINWAEIIFCWDWNRANPKAEPQCVLESISECFLGHLQWDFQEGSTSNLLLLENTHSKQSWRLSVSKSGPYCPPCFGKISRHSVHFTKIYRTFTLYQVPCVADTRVNKPLLSWNSESSGK